jgi:hypothetical protein
MSAEEFWQNDFEGVLYSKAYGLKPKAFLFFWSLQNPRLCAFSFFQLRILFRCFIGLLDNTPDTTTDAIRQHRSHIPRKTMPRLMLLTPMHPIPAKMAVG